MKTYIEFCNEQADKLFQIIDQHRGLLTWRKTWDVKGCVALPKSRNGYYGGMNLWNLLIEQIDRGLISNTWMTFNQIKQQGGHVLKGAKGAHVYFFKLKEDESDEVVDTDKQKLIPIFRLYTVFNLNQTSLAGQITTASQMSPSVQELVNILGITISEFGNQPCYIPSDDVIVMPRQEFFDNAENYIITLLHEIVHATGRESRLNRECARQYSACEKARAEEELVAEIGSVFLAGYFGFSGDLVNHASYVSSWKKLLDTKSVGRAMSQAAKAFQWIVAKIDEQTIEAAA